MNENITKIENLIDPEVMAPMISGKVEKAIVVTPFAKIDTTLVNQPGDTITVPKYAYIGDAEDVAEGVEAGTVKLTATKKDYKVKKAVKAVTLTDEAVLSGYGNPVGETNNQVGLSIASKVDQDAIEELQNAPLVYKASGAISYNGIVDAIDLFNEEVNTDKAMFISPKQVTTLRKDSNFISADKYNNNVVMKGEIGMVSNARIVPSRRVILEDSYTVVDEPKVASIGTYYEKTSTGYVKTTDTALVEGKTYYTKDTAKSYACPIVQLNPEEQTDDDTSALTIYLKRDTQVETERHAKAGITDVVANKHYVAALTDESKVVVAKFTA